MKILDKMALNRLILITTNFILAVLKIFAPHIKTEDLEDNTDGGWFPKIRKKLKRKQQ